MASPESGVVLALSSVMMCSVLRYFQSMWQGICTLMMNVVCACCEECCGPCDVVWNVYTVCVMSLVVCRWVSYAYACCCVPFRYFVLAKLIP